MQSPPGDRGEGEGKSFIGERVRVALSANANLIWNSRYEVLLPGLEHYAYG